MKLNHKGTVMFGIPLWLTPEHYICSISIASSTSFELFDTTPIISKKASFIFPSLDAAVVEVFIDVVVVDSFWTGDFAWLEAASKQKFLLLLTLLNRPLIFFCPARLFPPPTIMFLVQWPAWQWSWKNPTHCSMSWCPKPDCIIPHPPYFPPPLYGGICIDGRHYNPGNTLLPLTCPWRNCCKVQEGDNCPFPKGVIWLVVACHFCVYIIWYHLAQSMVYCPLILLT